jgi:catechol 2,3-dioxygenase-like lactoylglutathione lyase family enzyme
MLKPTHIAETALYVDDMARAAQFYTRLFDASILRRDERLCALRINDQQVLLLFLRGGSLQAVTLEGGVIPAHDGHGLLHVCFGIGADEISAWEQRLRQLGIAIESRMRWPPGGTSLYFRDPDGHAVELATPSVWG